MVQQEGAGLITHGKVHQYLTNQKLYLSVGCMVSDHNVYCTGLHTGFFSWGGGGGGGGGRGDLTDNLCMYICAAAMRIILY